MMTIKTKFFLGVIFLAVVLFTGGCSDVRINSDGSTEYREYFEEVYAASDSFVLKNFCGRVIVEPATDDKIKVQYCKRLIGSSEERLKQVAKDLTVEVTQSSDELRIQTNQPLQLIFGARSMIEFHIFLPENILTNISTSNSSIAATALQQDIIVSSSNAALTIKDHQGNIRAKTSNGSINLNDCQGYLDLNTSNGKIICNDIQGALMAGTSNGGIIVQTTGSLSGVDLDTSNGPIDFKGQMVQGSEYYFNTSNGRIRVWLDSKLGYDLKANTRNGRVRFDYPFQYAGSSKKNSLQGQIGQGGTQLIMGTSNGHITIYGVED